MRPISLKSKNHVAIYHPPAFCFLLSDFCFLISAIAMTLPDKIVYRYSTTHKAH